MLNTCHSHWPKYRLRKFSHPHLNILTKEMLGLILNSQHPRVQFKVNHTYACLMSLKIQTLGSRATLQLLFPMLVDVGKNKGPCLYLWDSMKLTVKKILHSEKKNLCERDLLQMIQFFWNLFFITAGLCKKTSSKYVIYGKTWALFETFGTEGCCYWIRAKCVYISGREIKSFS